MRSAILLICGLVQSAVPPGFEPLEVSPRKWSPSHRSAWSVDSPEKEPDLSLWSEDQLVPSMSEEVSPHEWSPSHRSSPAWSETDPTLTILANEWFPSGHLESSDLSHNEAEIPLEETNEIAPALEISDMTPAVSPASVMGGLYDTVMSVGSFDEYQASISRPKVGGMPKHIARVYLDDAKMRLFPIRDFINSFRNPNMPPPVYPPRYFPFFNAMETYCSYMVAQIARSHPMDVAMYGDHFVQATLMTARRFGAGPVWFSCQAAMREMDLYMAELEALANNA